MVIGLGVDLFDVARMERELRQDGAFVVSRLFTARERARCNRQRHPARHYAAHLAAKEAAFKALALEGDHGWRWHDVEVARTRGRCELAFHGALNNAASRLRVGRVLLSLDHTPRFAVAIVVLEA